MVVNKGQSGEVPKDTYPKRLNLESLLYNCTFTTQYHNGKEFMPKFTVVLRSPTLTEEVIAEDEEEAVQKVARIREIYELNNGFDFTIEEI